MKYPDKTTAYVVGYSSGFSCASTWWRPRYQHAYDAGLAAGRVEAAKAVLAAVEGTVSREVAQSIRAAAEHFKTPRRVRTPRPLHGHATEERSA